MSLWTSDRWKHKLYCASELVMCICPCVCVCVCVCVFCAWHRAAIVLPHSVGVIIKGSMQNGARVQCTQTETQRATGILYVQVYITTQMDVMVSVLVFRSNPLHVCDVHNLSFFIICNILSWGCRVSLQLGKQKNNLEVRSPLLILFFLIIQA